MSKVMRSVKNVTKGYSSVQIKVREATSNDSYGPTGTQMSEIAQLTYHQGSDFVDIMDMLDKRLNDKGKNWRHVLKALKVLDYCLHEGSETVVTWARQNIYIIKTLREFQYTDEDGRDVGQSVRAAAKELTSLILDEERLRAERSDRRSWKSRVTGLDEYGPPQLSTSQRPERRRPTGDEDDAEYRLAIEASKAQEEEDRRKRAGRVVADAEDDDLAKAIKLSKEEEERRRKELEENNATSLFDDDLIQVNAQPQYNQGYQQGNQVDFFANPVDQSQMQPQQTGFMPNAYTGFIPQTATGFPGGYSNGFMDPYGQQQMQSPFQQQQTGYNPYTQVTSPQPQPQSQPQMDPGLQPGSNNPWASNTGLQSQIKPTPTGSNNPFASSLSRPQAAKAPSMPALGTLPEQKTLSTFQSQPSATSFGQPQQAQMQPQPTPPSFTAPRKELSEHEAKMNALLAGGDGMDTFGNTGQLRIPAQHTAPGTFVNSAGSGINRLASDTTGASNPFLRTQFTGMPGITYGGGGGQTPGSMGTVATNGASNPFAGNRPQQNNQSQDLIQF